MNKSIIPEHWHCIEQEGNDFFRDLAQKYVFRSVNEENVKDVIIDYSKEATTFIDSPAGQESDASVKEVTNVIIDFLVALTKNCGLSEEDIIILWQDIYYNQT